MLRILRQCVNGIQNAVVNKGINRAAYDELLFSKQCGGCNAGGGGSARLLHRNIVVFLAGALDDFDICAVICSEVTAPFIMNFMLPVPLASVPAADLLRNICCRNDMLGIGTIG